MLAGIRQPHGCLGCHRHTSRQQPALRPLSLRRCVVIKAASGNNWFSGKGNNKEDAARKAIEGSFDPKKFGSFFGSDNKAGGTPAGDSGSGGSPFSKLFGGGGGGGGSGGFGGAAAGGGGGSERPIWDEFVEMMRYIWVVFWNAALFLAIADILHRSLDWCCQVELLLLVGAPQQAFERVASKFFGMIEWLEKNLLGWDIPQDEDMIPMYENIALYYPEEHAYTFDQYRYNVTAEEKKKLKHFYALRHYERDGGYKGDVDAADVRAIKDKYNPMEADRRAYQQAKATGTLDAYWASRKEQYDRVVSGRTKI